MVIPVSRTRTAACTTTHRRYDATVFRSTGRTTLPTPRLLGKYFFKRQPGVPGSRRYGRSGGHLLYPILEGPAARFERRR